MCIGRAECIIFLALLGKFADNSWWSCVRPSYWGPKLSRKCQSHDPGVTCLSEALVNLPECDNRWRLAKQRSRRSSMHGAFVYARWWASQKFPRPPQTFSRSPQINPLSGGSSSLIQILYLMCAWSMPWVLYSGSRLWQPNESKFIQECLFLFLRAHPVLIHQHSSYSYWHHWIIWKLWLWERCSGAPKVLEVLSRAAVKWTNLRGQMPICGFLRVSAVSCENLQFSVKVCVSQMLFSLGKARICKISENPCKSVFRLRLSP